VMAGEHPSEPTLLAFVEGELEGNEHASVETHLTACASCAADVALVRQGQEAMRAAPLLELPPETRDRILETLPVRHAIRATGRRWLAVAAPIAATLAVAGVIATVIVVDPSGDNGSDGGGGDAAAVDEAAGETAGKESAGGATEGGATTGPTSALKLAVDTPHELATELRRRGFDAHVENGTVVVRTQRKAALKRLLADYPRDAVRVRIEP
jgi:putative zinc finger protein